MTYYPENIEYWLHAKKVLYKKIKKLKAKKIIIPPKMIKEVLFKVYRKVMSNFLLSKEAAELYVPVMVKE